MEFLDQSYVPAETLIESPAVPKLGGAISSVEAAETAQVHQPQDGGED
jgi:hypothetical protein